MKKTVVWICIPSYDGRVTTCLAHALQHAVNLSLDPNHPFDYVPFMPVGLREVDFARNFCVAMFLKDPQAEKLLFIDADMNPPVDKWWVLARHNVDVVSGLSCGWIGYRELDGRVPQVCTVMYVKDLETGAYQSTTNQGSDPFYVDAVGAGCLCISRRLLERIEPPWFETTKKGPLLEIAEGEDMFFFRKANALGVKALIDPRIEFGHDKRVDVMDISRFIGALFKGEDLDGVREFIKKRSREGIKEVGA